MPTKPGSFDACPPTPAAVALGLETLEPRLLMAGDVTAAVVGGDLILRGDARANHVVIDQAGLSDGQFRIAGADGTTVNGTAGPLVLDNVTGALRAALGRGDDVLELLDAVLPSGLLVCTRRGGDAVNIEHVEVAGDVVVRTGGGRDEVRLDSVTVGGQTELSTGGRDDRIVFERGDGPGNGFAFTGRVFLRAGAGADDIYIRWEPPDPDGDGVVRDAADVADWPDGSVFRGGRGRDVLHLPDGELWAPPYVYPNPMVQSLAPPPMDLCDVELVTWDTRAGYEYRQDLPMRQRLELTVSTDKEVYYYGEPVVMTVTIVNNGGEFRMEFPDSTQGTVLIDGTHKYPQIATMMFTWLTIPAGGTATWQFLYNWQDFDMSPGEHTVEGGLRGTALTDVTTFRIVPLPDPPTEDVLIDFETLPDGSMIHPPSINAGLNYGVWGVHFRSIAKANRAPHVQEEDGNHLLRVNSCTYPPGHNLVADFDMPVYAVSADVTAPAGETVTMIARGADGEVLAVAESAPAAEAGGLFGPVQVSSATPIASVEWWPYVENCSVSIDNVHVIVTPPT